MKKGAREGGFLGFGKGVAQGLLGAVVKPVAGTLDMVSDVTAGVRNTATYFDDAILRLRVPRAFAENGKVLTEYDAHMAEGMSLAFLMGDSKFEHLENYSFHAVKFFSKKIF